MDKKPGPSEEIVVLIDSHDNEIGSAPRKRVRDEGLMHRVTYLLVFNSDGQLLVQTRTLEKDVFPGLLDMAAGGVVLAGETYEQSAQRELMEELGIDAVLESCFDLYFENRSNEITYINWGRVFRCCWDGPFELQPEEVAEVEFMDIQQALAIDPALVSPDTRLALLAYV